MGELTKLPANHTISFDVRTQAAKLRRKLARTTTTCTALSIKADWCKKLRNNAKGRNAVTFREIASGPNFLLLAALSLLGTAFCWIMGDLMHWTLGILFAIAGLCVSFFVVLRVTFNATLFSDEQLKRIQEASAARLGLLQADAAKLEAELLQLKPLLDAEIQYERELKRLQAEQGAEVQRRKKEEELHRQMEAQLRRNGTPPTERQLRFAAHLGMRISGNESKEELSLLIARILAKQTPEQEADSKRRWLAGEHQAAFEEIKNAIQAEIDDALATNTELDEQFITGFVVIRGDDCGPDHHGTYVKISDVHTQRNKLPPFEDCDYYNCECEIMEVMQGETAKQVFRECTA